MVVCLQQGANDLHMVKLMPLPPHHLLIHLNPDWFIFLMPAYSGCSGKEAVKQVCVCLSACTTTTGNHSRKLTNKNEKPLSRPERNSQSMVEKTCGRGKFKAKNETVKERWMVRLATPATNVVEFPTFTLLTLCSSTATAVLYLCEN